MNEIIAIFLAIAVICLVAAFWLGCFTLLVKIILLPFRLVWKLITLPFRIFLH